MQVSLHPLIICEMIMEEVLRTENISKNFPGVKAVDNVSFSLMKGEILALIGENGAGKSTLSQILSGVYKPDEGQFLLEGALVVFFSPNDAIQQGISMVFQELSLVGSLSVAENLFANRQPTGKVGNIHWSVLYQQTHDFLQRFNLNLDPRQQVKYLSMGQQQILEILKAISTDPKVLILDEPSSSLTEAETTFLFENIRKLQQQGMSFIYITHKLSEVFQIADQVMVMRDGKYVSKRDVHEVTESDLVNMMVGREIRKLYGASGKPIQEEYFRVEGFTRDNFFTDILLNLKRGEIIGLAGLIGAGRTQIGRSIFGIDPHDSGRIFLNGKEIHISKPLSAIENGIAYLTEDRKGQGLFLSMSIRENIVAPSLRRFTARSGFLDSRRIDRFANEAVEQYSIATPSITKKLINLSGGNQQKCLIAMWMGINPKVIIFDEPTRGVDVGARAEIYQKLRDFAATGIGVIMISSDLPELIGMCNRILVVHHGRISGEIDRADFTEERIMALSAGIQYKPNSNGKEN
jgi:ABC-type sugar transport system ATPase subunit